MYFSKNITSLSFNSYPSYIMHIDLNSCFATIEQQANPKLRGKPIAVAAYATSNGCILAPSIEAKKYGIKTGMRVKDGKALYPNLIVLSPDAPKYRYVHLKLRSILSNYTNDFYPKSIDEFVLNLEGYPVLKSKTMHQVAREIKAKIRKEIGEWMTVSVGIAPNHFLAKTASSLHKPDGLDEINKDNYIDIYKNLELRDLCGINVKNTARLGGAGIFTVLDFYNATVLQLRSAFASIAAYYWYLRLRGWEVDSVDFGRKSFGNSYSFPKPFFRVEDIAPILCKLTEKTGTRLRDAGYKAQGIHLGISYRDHSFWHKGAKTSKSLFDSRDIYKQAFRFLVKSPRKPVRELAVSCFNLSRDNNTQLEIFDDIERKNQLVQAVDNINDVYGNFSVSSARMIYTSKEVPDRIAFGGVKDLQEAVVW